ncbi:MAG TPA: VOC family protein [Terriglobia bacterium]|nr:VOC family protein [Terriglobia bacterium]
MLGSARIMAFVPTVDMQVARPFYESVLGLRFLVQDPFAAEFDAGGIMVRVTEVPDFKPQPFTVLGWQVDDIEKTVVDLKEKGVVFPQYGFTGQDPLGIWTAPSGARVAWFKDPDGNVLSVTQFPAGSPTSTNNA